MTNFVFIYSVVGAVAVSLLYVFTKGRFNGPAQYLVLFIKFLDEFFGEYRNFLVFKKTSKISLFAYTRWKWKAESTLGELHSLLAYLFLFLFLFVICYFLRDVPLVRAISVGFPGLFLASILFFTGKILRAHFSVSNAIKKKQAELVGLGLNTSDEAVFEELAKQSEFVEFVEFCDRLKDVERMPKSKFRFVKRFLLILFVVFFPTIYFFSLYLEGVAKHNSYCKKHGCSTSTQLQLNATKNATSEPQN